MSTLHIARIHERIDLESPVGMAARALLRAAAVDSGSGPLHRAALEDLLHGAATVPLAAAGWRGRLTLEACWTDLGRDDVAPVFVGQRLDTTIDIRLHGVGVPLRLGPEKATLLRHIAAVRHRAVSNSQHDRPAWVPYRGLALDTVVEPQPEVWCASTGIRGGAASACRALERQRGMVGAFTLHRGVSADRAHPPFWRLSLGGRPVGRVELLADRHDRGRLQITITARSPRQVGDTRASLRALSHALDAWRRGSVIPGLGMPLM